MRPLLFLLSAILLSSLTIRAEDEAKEPLPPLDIVVTAKLNTSKEHQANYALTVQREVTGFFPELIRHARGRKEEIKDGAALHRLQIDITGTVTIGNAITSVLQKNLFTEGLSKGGADAFLRIFYISGQQQTTANCKLLKWEDDKYKEVMKWTAPLVKRPDEEKNNGAIEIGRSAGRSAQQQDTGKPPMTVEQAQQVALGMLLPGSITDGVLGKLVEVKPIKAEPSKETAAIFTVDLTITNKSPWPLRRINTLVLWKTTLLSVGDTPRGSQGFQVMEFPEPLKPDETKKLTVKAKSMTDKSLKPGIREVDFAPPPQEAAPPQQ
jgi:hypothetical protein